MIWYTFFSNVTILLALDMIDILYLVNSNFSTNKIIYIY